MSSLSRLLENIMASPTVPPSFERCDILAAIVFIGTETQPISRSTLMKQLDLKEGPVKTLLRRLEQNKLVQLVGNRGHVLTDGGKTWNREVRARIVDFKEVHAPGVSFAEFAYAIQLRGSASFVESGIEQRDQALLVGAIGATTLVFEKGELKVPSVSMRVVDRKTVRELVLEFRFEEGDTLIVAMGNTPSRAQRGAFNAALSSLLKLEREPMRGK
ncbi:MAG: DUF4443 domain-containing protein [Candidatus Atabeyarchaeum deiterrae]